MSELQKLINICHSNLKNSKECLKYLNEKRCISSELISKYKIGFFPQNVKVLTNHVSEDILNKLNILDYSKNSDFANYFYLIFPII